MENKLLVITEGGKEFGFGHLTRTLSLCQAFEKYNYQIKYFVNGDSSVENILSKYEFELISWEDETQRLFSNVKKSNLILIDSMKISDILVKQIEALNIPVIFFDDEKRKNLLDKGFVIDWTVLSEKSDYFIPKKKAVSYFLGSKYTALRKDFMEATPIKIKKNINSILISFGGADVRNLSPLILEKLVKLYPNVKKQIIIGPSFQNIEEIKKVKDDNTQLLFNLNSKEMLLCMKNSDLAISAGGQTLYELAKVGLPTLAILLVDNAKDDTLGWSKVGFLKYLGWYDDKDLLENLELSLKEVEKFQVRDKMQKATINYVNNSKESLLVKEIMEKINDNI